MADMFRPPVNRAMRVIDRSFFQKSIPIAAARVHNDRNISRCRAALTGSVDILQLRAVAPVQKTPSPNSLHQDQKCVLLRPGIIVEDSSTWSDTIQNLVAKNEIGIIPYNLQLNYDHWTARKLSASSRDRNAYPLTKTDDILCATLPEDIQDEIPTGFSIVGHIAHLNLREECLPYKTLIAQVIKDKNPTIRTVINKVDTLGEENAFRVLDSEVLVGDEDLFVEQRESNCTFRFDYSKVFWNTRLHTEHRRLVEEFTAGEAVCDVMAGVGPFAVPAGKKGVFVYANDLNPDCYSSLEDAIKLNKVENYVKAYNEDGHKFIVNSAQYLLESEPVLTVKTKVTRSERDVLRASGKDGLNVTEIPRPRTFSHYVMNLPSTAIDFLPSFIGLYAKHEKLFKPNTATSLPFIHVYCFAPPVKDLGKGAVDGYICESISEKLKYKVNHETTEVSISEVRDVAPNKSQYCAKFRLPKEVAFREAV